MFKYNDELMHYALNHKEAIEKDYQATYQSVGNSNAVYKGKQLPYLYYPAVYSEEDYSNFEDLTQQIFNIVNKSIDVYLKHPEVREVWGFDKRLEELILVEPKFRAKVPMGRFDFFYYPNGDYMFCELNTDGTSAMNEETPLTDILIEHMGMKHFRGSHNVRRFELYQSWVDEVADIYSEFCSETNTQKEKPYVIIMDFFSKGSPHEFEVFKETFINSGYMCDVVSPDQLTYKDGYLYHNDQRVDIIYRRLVTRDLMERYDDLAPLVQGIKANNTCIIGSIQSQVVHTKKYFEALHHPMVRKYFNSEELAYIDRHIPFTSALNDDEHLDMYIKNKDDYIIKPMDYYASKGVYAGKEFSEEEWIEKLNEGIASGYIIQKFCPKSINKNLYFDESGEMHIKEVNNITGIFVYNEKLKGLFTRAGFNAVISDLNDGYSLSSIVSK